jgi:hypothetical protein
MSDDIAHLLENALSYAKVVQFGRKVIEKTGYSTHQHTLPTRDLKAHTLNGNTASFAVRGYPVPESGCLVSEDKRWGDIVWQLTIPNEVPIK